MASVVRSILWLLACIYYTTCTQVNVALHKNTSTTSGVYITPGREWYPSGVVDGDNIALSAPSSCYHAKYVPSDWTVDLGDFFQLYNIDVYVHEYFLYRTANSSIYLNNDPSRVCYTFPSIISDNPTRLTCNETARYVTIRNPGTEWPTNLLNICEVEIYACTGGSRGVDCEVDCHCDECDRWTGFCNSTCTPGWEGARCDRACNGTYGSNCINSCAARQCINSSSSCDPSNGTCDSGCLSGWTGHDCITECSTSTYGLNCSNICTSRHCQGNSTCDHVTGSCDHVCMPGWKSIDCTEECTEGEEFGPNCSSSCSARHCLNESSCPPATGVCDNGCETGWEGPQCLQGTRVADGGASDESTKTDTAVIALSTTVGVLVAVIIIVILTVFLIRMRRKSKSSSDKTTTDGNRTVPELSPTTDHIYTDITLTSPATYETLGQTEDNQYTSLEGTNVYVNTNNI